MAARAETLVSVEEYLHNSYEPDCDFVDGQLEERNVGERDHNQIQGELYFYLRLREGQLNIRVHIEQRVQINANRFRVPDVCVTLTREQIPPIISVPPFLCIEVLSREDRLPRVLRKANEYIAFGVPNVWIVDPIERVGYTYSATGLLLSPDSILATANPEIRVNLSERFAAIG